MSSRLLKGWAARAHRKYTDATEAEGVRSCKPLSSPGSSNHFQVVDILGVCFMEEQHLLSIVRLPLLSEAPQFPLPVFL